jgi:hypothetical protein
MAGESVEVKQSRPLPEWYHATRAFEDPRAIGFAGLAIGQTTAAGHVVAVQFTQPRHQPLGDFCACLEQGGHLLGLLDRTLPPVDGPAGTRMFAQAASRSSTRMRAIRSASSTSAKVA